MKDLNEGHFFAAFSIIVLFLVAWGVRGLHLDEVRIKQDKIAFAKACEERELNFAVVNGSWVCLKYEGAE